MAGLTTNALSQNVGIGTNTPMTRLHFANGSDASYTTPSGYLIIGNPSLTNLIFDDNEILARNNGAASPLYLRDWVGGDYLWNPAG